uniref:dUTP diphosphatase n=1 Tax=candidate division CPR3 bacterium TaxID=2268181 RepID=A0A7C4R2L2_UNCC3
MNIQIKLIDGSLPLPEYQTTGSVAFDLYSRVDMEIAPKTIALIPLNIIIQTPAEYAFLVVPRSSTPKKKGLLIPHGIGIIDQDYCGEEDEVKFQCYNFSEEVVKIEKGERVAQGMFVKIAKVDFEKIDKINAKTRGGFGSTG